MTLETLHFTVRMVLLLWSTVFMALLTRSLMLAFFADYGWPWRRRPGSNGRSALDLDIVIREGLFVILGLMSTISAVDAIQRGRTELPLSEGSLRITAYVLVFAVFGFRVWRGARRERLYYVRRQEQRDIEDHG